jgi:hypothetical protein
MQIDREKLHEMYMAKVNQIAEECDWVTSFGPQAIVNMIADIIESTPELIIKEEA